MAVFNQPIHWGHKDVDWTYVPDSAEMAATWRPLVAEALGMLAFVFVAGAAIVNGGEIGLLGMAAATAVGYVVMVSLFQPISGGHINPAVTVGMVAARRLPPSIGILYIAAQFGGAILGALLLNLIFDDFVADAAAKTASLSFAGDMNVWIGGLLEAILAFILVVVYFRAYVDPKGDRSTGALALGMVVLFSFLVAFPLTGAALNLARVFGTDLVAGAWTDFGYYWLGLAGGAAAGFLYEHLFAVREEES